MSSKIIKREASEHPPVLNFIYEEAPRTFHGPAVGPRSARTPGSNPGTEAGAVSAERLAAVEDAAYKRGVADTEARFREQLASYSSRAATALQKSAAELAEFQRRMIHE